MAVDSVVTRQILIDGFSVRLHEVAHTSASPLLCIHGGPGLDSSYFFPNPEIWRNGLFELAEEHHVVAYDQRGCGETETPGGDQPFALSRQVNDIERVRRALDLEAPAVLGHSFGTVLALLYALYYPESISRLILIGGCPTRDFIEGYRRSVMEELSTKEQARLAAIQESDLTDESYRERFSITLPLYFDKLPGEAQRTALLDKLSFNASVNRSLATDVEDYDLRPALPSLRTPALVLYGERDRIIRPEYQLQFQGHLLGARFVGFQESGHFPFLEEPEPFAHVVDYFLKHGHPTPRESSASGEGTA